MPGAVTLFDWVEALRGREQLFVIDEGGASGLQVEAERRRRTSSSDESGDGKSDGAESDDEEQQHDRPPSPPPLASLASCSSPPPGTYTTVAEEHSESYEVKKSTFVATCFPIKSSTQAEARIRARSDPAARHNCWAFVTPAGDDARCSDDGEPG